MNNTSNDIKRAFDSIHAEDSLKSNTIEFINTKRKPFSFPRLMPLAAAFVLFIIVGISSYLTYNTSTALISIDVNPSIELKINRFNKVISVEGYNDDGTELANNLDIINMNYEKAVEKILSLDFDDDSVFSITVASKNENRKEHLLSKLQNFSKDETVFCGSATEEEVKEAHQAGLSFGKYKAYKKLHQYDEEITTDKIKDMPMKDIQNKLKDYENDRDDNHDDNNKPDKENGKQENHNGENHNGVNYGENGKGEKDTDKSNSRFENDMESKSN